jgi:hypothetical protein
MRQYLDSIAVDAWKIKVCVIAGLLCVAGVMIAFPSHDGGAPSYDYEDLSPDCQHVDTALRAWGRVTPGINQTMASGVGATGTPPDPAMCGHDREGSRGRPHAGRSRRANRASRGPRRPGERAGTDQP